MGLRDIRKDKENRHDRNSGEGIRNFTSPSTTFHKSRDREEWTETEEPGEVMTPQVHCRPGDLPEERNGHSRGKLEKKTWVLRTEEDRGG